MQQKHVAILFACASLVQTVAFADAQAAKNYVKEAKDLIEHRDYDEAKQKLELADAELEDTPAAAKPPIAAEIASARQSIVSAQAAADVPRYRRALDNAMREAEGSIGNLATWTGASNRVNEVLNDPAAKAALGPDLDAAAKKFATFKRLNDRKAAVEITAQIDTNLKQIESDWSDSKKDLADSDTSSYTREHAVESTRRDLQRQRQEIAKLPADDENGKKFAARLDAIESELTSTTSSGAVKEVVATLNRQYELYREDWNGYEQETAGPTWEEFRTHQSEKMSSFLAPKTRVFIERMSQMLKSLHEIEDYKETASSPQVVAIVHKVQTERDAAYAKMVKFVKPVVDGGLKAGNGDSSAYGRLDDDVRLALGQDSPDGKTLRAALDNFEKSRQNAAAGASAATSKMYSMLTEKASEEWPKLSVGFNPQRGVDITNASNVGKTIIFDSDNLAGYRFKPGDFYFMTTLSGNPAAGHMDPALATRIAALEKKLGRSLGDDDSDGRWQVIAVITNRKAKLMQRHNGTATGTIDGLDVKITSEYAEPVDAVVIEIVAAKIGPFAGAKGKGVLREDGTVGN